MPRLITSLIFTFTIFGISQTGIHGQTNSTTIVPKGPVVLDLPASTRSMAMGNAFQLADPTSDVLFYNPSLLSGPTTFEMARQTFGHNSSLTQMSAKTEWWKGGIGIGIQSLTYADDFNYSLPSIVTQSEYELFQDGRNRISESVATAGYSMSLAGLDWGISTKAIEQGAGGSRNQSFAFDFGGSGQLGIFTFGLAHQNLGRKLRIGNSQMTLKNRTTLGAAFNDWILGPLDVGGSAALSKHSDGSITQSIGGEISWWPVVGRTFTARFGVRNNEQEFRSAVLTFGIAFRGDAFGLDYASNEIEGAGHSHRLSISWRQ